MPKPHVGFPFLVLPESDWSLFISSLQGKSNLAIIGWWSDNVEAKLKAKFSREPFTPILYNASTGVLDARGRLDREAVSMNFQWYLAYVRPSS